MLRNTMLRSVAVLAILATALTPQDARASMNICHTCLPFCPSIEMQIGICADIGGTVCPYAFQCLDHVGACSGAVQIQCSPTQIH